MQFPGWIALIPIAGASCIIAAQHGNKFQDLIANRGMVLIGKISYPLYLWHYPIFSYLRIYESNEPSVAMVIFSMGLSLLLAFLTYQFIERPIRFGRFKQASNQMIIGTLVTALLLVGILGKLTQRERGFASRMGGEWRTNLAQMNESQGGETCAFLEPNPDSSCLISNSKADPTVALIGDSHAVHFFAGVATYVASTGGNLIALSGPGCVPFLGVRTRQVKGDPEICGGIVDRIFSSIDDHPQIKTVVIATRGPMTLTGKPFGQDEVPGRYIDSDQYPDAHGASELFSQGLEVTLKHLTSRKKEVVFIFDNPELGFNPELCGDLSLVRKTHPTCKIAREQVEARNFEYRALVTNVLSRYPTVKVIDTLKTFCDADYCYARKDEQLIYRDNNHLTRFGSMLLTPAYQF
jgi:hypothetical protein